MSNDMQGGCGTLFVVGTPIGNLDDFSPRGVKTLEQADFIAAEDTRVSQKLLSRFGIKKPMMSYYKPKEREKSEGIIALLKQGKNGALITDAGMPCISDPGGLLVRLCRENGIAVQSVPGASAAVTALAISGIECGRFVFEGFLPTDRKERGERLDGVKKLPHTLVFYEAPHKLERTLRDLGEALGGERSAALCRELTKLHEQVMSGTLSELAKHFEQNEPRGEFVIVVEGCGEGSPAMSAEQAAEIARGLVAEGAKLSDACREAAKITGIPKREIYEQMIDDR